MTAHWWEVYFWQWAPWSSVPYYTWFWVGPNDVVMQEMNEWWGWPLGHYEVYKIPASGGHNNQIAFRSPVDFTLSLHGATRAMKANVIYILTYQGDTPNYGQSSGMITISPPCSNWVSNVYEGAEATRSQTFSARAAIRAERDIEARIQTAIAFTGALDCGVDAAIAGNPQLSCHTKAAVLGEAWRYFKQRAAIRTERSLNVSQIAAIAHDFDLPCDVLAAIRGSPHIHYGQRAAIRGEAQKSVGISALIMKDRTQNVYLEMENLIPQELALRPPNWPSTVKDWRKGALG